MAHRLISTASRESASPAPGTGGPDSATRLGARAQALLDADDVEGYRSLFVPIAQLKDPHRRYHAQVVLLELGLAVAAGWESDRSGPLRMAVAEAAIEALETEPSEPLVLNAAAVALGELGSFDCARELLDAAARLDPSLPQLRENSAALHSRRHVSRRRVVSPELASLARRATLTADRARPASGLTLSLCMIVRDEEDMLARCLAAAAPAVDEIVVVDTGSRDTTIQIARSFGARVIEHAWTDSFSEARNIALEAATGDWVMALDADQVLVSDDVSKLRALTGHTWREAFTFAETSHVGEAADGHTVTRDRLKMFRNRPSYRYRGRVHEDISHTLPLYAPGRIERTSVRLRHDGYLKSVVDTKGKTQRNIRLLRMEVEENPGDAFLRFTLGSEYAAAGDNEEALPEFERAWSMMSAYREDANEAYVLPQLIDRMVKALRLAGRLADAASLTTEGLRRYPTFTDLVIAQANMAAAGGAYRDARELYRRCIELGDAPARYRPLAGCGTYLPRIGLAVLEMIDGDYEQARELLGWCIENHPDFRGVVQPYVTLLARVRVRPVEAIADIERRGLPAELTAAFRARLRAAAGGCPEGLQVA